MRFSHEHPVDDTEKLLIIGILLSFLTFLLEFFGGFWSRSLALLSDAWHVFFDMWALIVGFLAVFLAKRPTTDRRTYGLHRMEVLAALANGFTVFFVALGILYAAAVRIKTPPAVHGPALLGVASIGLLLNLITAAMFYRKAEHDLNMRGIFLHLISDALSSVAVVIAGAIILLTGWRQVDLIVSALIACLILWNAVRLLRESFETLLEGVPRGIRATAVEEEIKRVDGVVSVHDLHIWSICSHLKALSGHILVQDSHLPRQDVVLDGINRTLKDHFGITHTTLQVESKTWPGVEVQY